MSDTILALDRALELLAVMADQHRPLGVTELSVHLDIPKAAVYRILRTLQARAFVLQDQNSELYSLGPEILRVSSRFRLHSALVLLAEPHLKVLAAETGEVASLGVMLQKKVMVLTSISGRPDSRLTLQLGPVAELHSSSLGKALLAGLTAQQIAALIGPEPFPASTPATITSLERLLQEVDKVRRTGRSMDCEETEEGLMCVGAPLRDWDGRIEAAISISTPKSRLNNAQLERYGQLVMQAADAISSELRGRGEARAQVDRRDTSSVV